MKLMCLKSTSLSAVVGQLFPLALGICAIATSFQPARADVVLPGRCHMGQCWDQKFLGKQVVKSGANGTLYSVKLATRSWPMDSRPQGRFGQAKVNYVYCSKTRPARIFNSDGTYYAHLLNPGGDWYGYNADDYPVYWATCHNVIGPDFFSEAMTTRAIGLGYSLNLPSEQIQLSNVLEIMN